MIFRRWFVALSGYVGILLTAAGSAPIFYLLVRHCSDIWSVGWLRHLAEKPLGCYVDRLRVIAGCIVVLVAVRKSPKKYRWNLHHGFSAYVKTFVFGIFVWMALFFVIKSFVPTVEFKATPTTGILLQAFVAGLLLATAEEMIFRGFLWDFVRNGRPDTFNGIVSVSLVFALLHFSHCDADNDSNPFLQSFQCALHSITDIPQRFVWEFFLCVFLLGLLLAVFRIRTQTIWGAVGFHQGLITTLFVLRKCVRYPEKATSHFWGTGKLTDSRFDVLVLCLICIIVFVQTRKRLRASEKEQRPAPS